MRWLSWSPVAWASTSRLTCKNGLGLSPPPAATLWGFPTEPGTNEPFYATSETIFGGNGVSFALDMSGAVLFALIRLISFDGRDGRPVRGGAAVGATCQRLSSRERPG